MVSAASEEDTIAAIATPQGAGGIGIIRISGEKSFSVLQQIFTPKSSSCAFTSHRLYYGHIHDDSKVIDEVMAVFMASPKSYTCEDVVEIHCHGSHLLLEDVLALVIRCGVRLADPGEFTRRAFLNGRIDLTQAEAVIDILAAKTRKGVELGQQQLAGALFRAIEPVQKSLLHASAFVEVAIDFPDEDIEIIDHSALIRQLQEEVLAPLEKLLAQAEQGRLYRTGISLVIAGAPNVGKSSLLNALLQEERALVTDIAGTTRDSIEEMVDVFGIPVRIIDTAGIRQHAGEVEELGIARAKELIGVADLVLFVVDGARGLTDEDRALFDVVCHKPVIVVKNKSDLLAQKMPPLSLAGIRAEVVLSAKKGEGLDLLRKAIFAEITAGESQWEENACAPNLRHKVALEEATGACRHILATLEMGLGYDLVAVDLHNCLASLSDITGETTAEDVLDVVFQQFCLGK